MRFVCLGYADMAKWGGMSDEERGAMMEECFAYDDELRRGGHFLGGEALESPLKGATIRSRDGRLAITDGPYAETKEHLGGLLFLEATDLTDAIRLMSKHPGLRAGTFEIRPTNEAMHARCAAREATEPRAG